MRFPARKKAEQFENFPNNRRRPFRISGTLFPHGKLTATLEEKNNASQILSSSALNPGFHASRRSRRICPERPDARRRRH
jgi:hypothetical protein